MLDDPFGIYSGDVQKEEKYGLENKYCCNQHINILMNPLLTI